MFRFLTFELPASPSYSTILKTLTEDPDAKLLDLGCGLGQELRKLAFDGVPVSKLVGVDLHQQFIDLGYALFKDSESSFGAKFVQADLLDTESAAAKLKPLAGTIDYVFAGCFLHVFDLAQQKDVLKQILALTKPRKGSQVLGWFVGSREPGEQSRLTKAATSMYSHNDTSFEKLFQEAVREQGDVGEWDVTVRLEEVEYEGDKAKMPEGLKGRVRLLFEATRA
jgi:SAM-dependent methyltransferase